MKPRAPFSPEIAVSLLNGLAAGRGLRALCRGPDMPTRPTVMRWLKQHPAFADLVREARFAGGLTLAGRPSGHSAPLVAHIYDRMSRGEPLSRICADPALPSRSTIHNWTHRAPATARALDMARENAAWARADAWWEANARSAGLSDD
jgi:hypothetical protein